MLKQVKAENLIQDLKMNHYTQILSSNTDYLDNFHEANNLRLRDLISSLNTFCLLNAMKINEFFNFNNEK
ncbi:10961_t:CDS:2, partial [Cetraspora pellucida]